MHRLFLSGGRRHVRSETKHSPHGAHAVETKQRGFDFETSLAMNMSLKVKPYSVQEIYFRSSIWKMICARFEELLIYFRIINFGYVWFLPKDLKNGRTAPVVKILLSDSALWASLTLYNSDDGHCDRFSRNQVLARALSERGLP